MITNNLRALVAAAAIAVLATGCSSVKLDETPTAPIVDKTQGTDGADSRNVAKVDTTGGAALDPFNDPANPLSKRSVYFDFDSYSVKPDYQSVVETHARYLSAN
ncbi:MAG: peptidoglycan-associated lipoprotein, partial [Burkholderiaceae bacterium]